MLEKVENVFQKEWKKNHGHQFDQLGQIIVKEMLPFISVDNYKFNNRKW